MRHTDISLHCTQNHNDYDKLRTDEHLGNCLHSVPGKHKARLAEVTILIGKIELVRTLRELEK